MARWPLPITLLTLSVTAAVATAPGGATPAPSPSATGEAEVIQVPPGLTSGSRVASQTAFEPGRAYRIKVSGTVTAKSQSETLVFSAFHCLQGCSGSSDHAYYPHLRIYSRPDGTQLAPNNLNKSANSGDAKYAADGKYVLTFDNFADVTRLEWSAEPHGNNPDAYGRYYSGRGFRVEIAEEPRIVTFRFKQAGLPEKPPRDMISSQLGAKGSLLLPGTDDLNHWVAGEPRGSAAYVAINEGKDHLVAFRLVDGEYVKKDAARGIRLRLEVRKSDDPGCRKDSRAGLELVDTAKKGDERAHLVSKRCGYNLRWTRASTDEFHISVGKPQ